MATNILIEPVFRDLLSEFNAARVDYLIVGAFAMGAHGSIRFTGDIDLFYRRTEPNAKRIVLALKAFGYSATGLKVKSLMQPAVVHFFGRPPRRVDLLNVISGVTFEEAWEDRVVKESDGLRLPILSFDMLLKNTRASPRPKDALDAEMLEKARSERARRQGQSSKKAVPKSHSGRVKNSELRDG